MYLTLLDASQKVCPMTLSYTKRMCEGNACVAWDWHAEDVTYRNREIIRIYRTTANGGMYFLRSPSLSDIYKDYNPNAEESDLDYFVNSMLPVQVIFSSLRWRHFGYCAMTSSKNVQDSEGRRLYEPTNINPGEEITFIKSNLDKIVFVDISSTSLTIPRSPVS